MKWIKRMLLVIIVFVLASLYSYGIWPRAIYDTDIGSGSYEQTELLVDNSVAEQRFQCTDNGLCGIRIKLCKMGNQTTGEYSWKVIEQKNGEIVGQGKIKEVIDQTKTFENSSPQKREFIQLNFPKQKNSNGQEYVLRIEGKDVSQEECLTLYITEKGGTGSSLVVNGTKVDKACVIRLQYERFNIETFIVFLAIVCYLVLFVKFMYKLFR